MADTSSEALLLAIWRDILAGALSTMGRLELLASCRDERTRRYSHAKLGGAETEEEIDRAIRLAHRLVWAGWLQGALEEQHADLLLFVSHGPKSGRSIHSCAARCDPQSFLSVIPDSAPENERQLFTANVETLRRLLQQNLTKPSLAAAMELLTVPDSAVQRLFEIVRHQYQNPNLTLRSVSRSLHLSERHLSRQLQKQARCSFRHYLRGIRIAEALSLLTGSTHDIKYIAGMVGYRNSSHFGQDFRECMVCTPVEFRAVNGSGALTRSF